MRRAAWRRATAAALAAVCSVLGACDSADAPARASEREQAAPVRVGQVEQVRLPKRIVVSADLDADRKATIIPEVGGVLKKVYKEEGDRVRKGERLAVVASTDFDLALESAQSGLAMAEAQIAQAQTQYDNAKTHFERFQRLRRDNAITQAEYEQAEVQLHAAEAALRAAQARKESATVGIASARKRVSDTVITAPFDGYVVQRMLEAGDLVKPLPFGSPLMVVVNNQPIVARAAVSELDAPHVKLGMPAEVRVAAFPEDVFRGEVDMVNQAVNAQTRSVAIRVRLPNEDGRLKAGMSGEIRLSLGDQTQVVVPRHALFDRRADRAKAYVLQGDIVKLRDVVFDSGLGEKLAVREGLEAGDRVVTWGQSRLRDGLRVRVVHDAPQPALSTAPKATASPADERRPDEGAD